MAKKPDWVAKAKRIIAEGDRAVATADRAVTKAEAHSENVKRLYYCRLQDVLIAARKADPELTYDMMAHKLGKDRRWVGQILSWGGKSTSPFYKKNARADRLKSDGSAAVRERPDIIVMEAAKLPRAKQRKFIAALRRAGVQEPEDASQRVFYSPPSRGRSAPPTVRAPSACDIDHEQGEGDTPAETRLTAFQWQSDEAVRMAEESKMLDAEPQEITQEVIARAQHAASAWAELVVKLKRLQKRRA